MSMFDTIQDAAKIGLGAVSLSKENLKKLTDDLVELGKVSKEEGERLFSEFDKAREERQQDLTETVEKVTREVVGQMGFAPKKEFEALQKRVAELEELLKDAPKPEGESDQ